MTATLAALNDKTTQAPASSAREILALVGEDLDVILAERARIRASS